MKSIIAKNKRRVQRKNHIRKTLSGTATKPRLTVFRSNKNISLQVIDDVAGHTLVSASSLETELKGLKSNIAGGTKMGQVIGERLKEAKVESIVFDRNGYKYHGVVKAIAEAARETGIKF